MWRPGGGAVEGDLCEEYTASERNAWIQTQVHLNPKYQPFSFRPDCSA